MTISLDQDYFAVADEPLLGYCGENNSRVIEFVGLENAEADVYSLVLSYDDGECYETRIDGNVVVLTNGMMRRSGMVDVQVYACKVRGDEYTVVRKSNILQLLIKPSLDEHAKPVPTMADCLRVLDQIESCTGDLTKLSELLAQYISQLEEQVYINKSAIGLEKRNLLRIGTCGFDNGEVTMSVGENGELTLNGSTSELYVSVPLNSDSEYDLKKHIPNGRYILCSNGFSKLAVAVIGYDLQNGQIVQRSLAWCDDGNDVEFTVDDEFEYNYVELYLDRDTSFDNELVLPMIRYAGISDSSWEPYKPDLQTQINELYELIGGGFSSYNETHADRITDSIKEVEK